MIKEIKIIFLTLLLLQFGLGKSSVFAQNTKIDSLTSLLTQTQSLEKKTEIHLLLSSLKLHAKPEEVLIHLNKARQYAKRIENDTLIFDIYTNYIKFFFLNQKHNKTFAYIDSALVYKNFASAKKVIKLHTIMAQNANFIGNFDKAIIAYNTALEICKSNNMDELKPGIYIGLSDVYMSKLLYEKAESNASEALKWSKENRNTANEMTARLNLGKIYFEKKETSKALENYNIVEDYLKKHSNIILRHSLNTNLGRFFRDTKQYDKAIFYFKENLKIDETIRNDIGMNTSRTDIARVLLLQKEHKQSIALLEKNLAHAKALDNPKMIQQNLLDLSIVYEQTGALKKSLEHRKLYEKWQDSIVNAENLKAISELEIKYQTEKKENEILQLSQTKLKNEVILEKKNLWIKRLVYGLLITLLLFSSGFIIFKQYSKNKKQRAIITAITEAQIAEQKRISQDLHDSVGGSLALTKTKLSDLKSTEFKEGVLDDILNALTNTANEVRQISHDLMPGELVKFGLIPALESLMSKAESQALKTNLYTFDVNERFDEKVEVHLFRIIQELVQNVLKHAKASTLNVYLNKHTKFLSLIVEDDGVGFDKIMTRNGMGFKTIKNRVDYLKGTLIVDSVNGSGSSFTIQIPLKI